MRFNLAMVAYVFALLAAGMALFGPLGILAGGLVLLFWAVVNNAPSKVVLLWLSVALLVVVAVLLLAPAMATARPAAMRNQCLNNLKQILLAIDNYRAARGTYPPAYSTDGDGKPLLSWRVLILPYMEHKALFKRFRLDEPWDGPNNRQLLSEMPEVFQCAGVQRCRGLGCLPYAERPAHVANFVAVVGDSTAWPPGRVRPESEVTDAPDETVLVLEFSGGTQPWTAPFDLELEEALDLLENKPPQGHIHATDSFFTISHYSMLYLAGMGSVHGRALPGRLDRDTSLALMTVSGGEDLSQWDPEWPHAKGDVVTEVRWGRVYAAIVFVLLGLLPAARRVRGAASNEGSPAAR